MNDQASSPSPGPDPESATEQAKPRWSFRRVAIKFTFVLLVLITLLAIFYAFENWRGKRAWHEYEAKARQAGKPLLLSDVMPPPIPDAENFAATPFLASLFQTNQLISVTNERWPELYNVVDQLVATYEESQNEPEQSYTRWESIPIPVWQAGFRLVQTGMEGRGIHPDDVAKAGSAVQAADGVLKALQVYTPVLDELRLASQRSGSRYNIDYSAVNPITIPLPHPRMLRNVCRVLRIRATAALTLGQTDQAWEDLKLIWALADSLKTEPILITHLVRMALIQISMQLFWEGMHKENSWSDVHLLKAQQHFAQYDFLADHNPVLVGERAFGNSIFDYIRIQRGEKWFTASIGLDDVSSDEFAIELFLKFCPRGWIYFEQLSYNQHFEEFLLSDDPSGGPRCDFQHHKENQVGLSESVRVSGYGILWRHKLMSALLLPGLSYARHISAYNQALVEMASLAAALERYHRAQGEFPPRLHSLESDFIDTLPDDVVAQQPYHYVLPTDGGFILYSIGWNQTDDQGVDNENRREGDWVWTRLPR